MIETKNLKKVFKNGDHETEVLRGINFKVQNGEFVTIMGRSGAGKSTLLYQISLLDEPSSGEVFIDNEPASKMNAKERAWLRLVKFGYVFQDYALLPDLTALENVALPLLAQGYSKSESYDKALHSLSLVGLNHRPSNLPSMLSGGEQQRVSIARAIAHEPKILFADEPTANLDNESSNAVIDIFKELHSKGQTIIMVTHEPEYGKIAQRTIKLDDGQII